MNITPKISVIMAVYNVNNNFLKESIESILNQTYKNFEFIIIDDCTTKENIEIIKEYKDERIKLIHNKENLGLTKSLNKAIAISKGKYIARMDADDISISDRLKTQLNFLEENEDVVVVGGLAKVIGENKIYMSRIENIEVMRMRAIFFNCVMVHPTAMINSVLLERYSIKYNESVKKAQDYMLWADCILNSSKIHVLNKILLKYRVHEGQDTKKCSNEQKKCAMYVQKKLIKQLIETELTDERMNLHWSIVSGKFCSSIKDYSYHFKELLQSNENKLIFDRKLFRKECYYMWILMTIKGIVFYKDFKGIMSPIFWKSMIRVDYWSYYFTYFIKPTIDEKKVFRKL